MVLQHLKSGKVSHVGLVEQILTHPHRDKERSATLGTEVLSISLHTESYRVSNTESKGKVESDSMSLPAAVVDSSPLGEPDITASRLRSLS